MTLVSNLSLIILFYVIGSLPFALIFTKLFGLGDIRKVGSGNVGATNVLRTGNKFVAFIVLCFDIFKGFLPFLILQMYFQDISLLNKILLCHFAILGHIYPVWLKFKGGKGVATYLGVYIAIVLQNPYNSEILNSVLFQLLNIPAIALFYFLLFKVTRVSAIASLSTVALTAGLLIFANNEFSNNLILAFVFILILLKHSENIKRLLEGKENKF